jgi:hypothetical protein
MTNPSFTGWFCSSKKNHGFLPDISQVLVQNSFSAAESGVAKILWEKEEGLLLTSQLPEWDPWPPKAGLAKCLSLKSRCWRSWSLSLYR